jgi:hypothetical protein
MHEGVIEPLADFMAALTPRTIGKARWQRSSSTWTSPAITRSSGVISRTFAAIG